MNPSTEAGKEAVRMRGLFGGETVERAGGWVAAIEAEARAALLAELEAALPEAMHRLAEDVRGGCDHSMWSIYKDNRPGYEMTCWLDAAAVLDLIRRAGKR